VKLISFFQFFHVLIGKDGVARKLFLWSMLSWINQDSVICGSKHFFHPAENDLSKSVLPGAPMNILLDETEFDNYKEKFDLFTNFFFLFLRLEVLG